MSDAPNGWKIEQAMAAWQSARQRLLADDGELAHDEAALAELLGEETGDVRSILGRLLRGSVHAKSMADAAGDIIDGIRARQDRYKRRSENMRSTAFAIMDAIDEPKIELPDLTASLRRGAPVAIITDESAVPEIYVEVVVTRKIDKAVILSALKSGEDVPGAILSNALPSLTIKVK